MGAGQGGGVGLVGKGHTDLKKGRIGKGLAPDDAARAGAAGAAVAGHLEIDGRFRPQLAGGGDAQTVVAQVQGPGLVGGVGARRLGRGYFGKAEKVALGQTDRTAAVDRAGDPVRVGAETGAAGVVTALAEVGNVLLHREKEAVAAEQAEVAGGVPVGAEAEGAGVGEGGGGLGRARIFLVHNRCYARTAPDAQGAVVSPACAAPWG